MTDRIVERLNDQIEWYFGCINECAECKDGVDNCKRMLKLLLRVKTGNYPSDEELATLLDLYKGKTPL